MDFPLYPAFAHRINRNGTTDSICKACFATVANSHWEFELERRELEHICDPQLLERFQQVQPTRNQIQPTRNVAAL